MSNPAYVGKKKATALFKDKNKVVFINTETLVASVSPVEDAKTLTSSYGWDTSSNPDPIWTELASVALHRESAPSDVSIAQSSKRTYTVPKRVSQSAQTALNIGGTSSVVSNQVASLLASGEQISCEDALWVSRFFAENSEQQVSRAQWLAWGGEEGKRWSQALASRLDYDSVVADAGSYETPGLAAFLLDEDAVSFWTERNSDDVQFVNNLYLCTPQGTWMAWGNGDWFNCPNPELSDRFIELDSEAALYVAGALFDAPEIPVDIRTPNPEAWDLAQNAEDEDWEFVDRTIRAAAPIPTKAANDYTPEERSKNASGQLRDANGRFAQVGASGAIKSSGLAGTIKSVDETTGKIIVSTPDGQQFEIPADDFEVGAQAHPKVDPEAIKNDPKVDFTGILAPPIEPVAPKATLSEAIPVMSAVQIDDTITQYSEKITEERQAKSKDFKKLLENPETAEEAVESPESIQAAGDIADSATDTPPPSADPTPDESDVDPIYMAIVDKDDPRAVTDLIALVPATATSSDPKTYRRSGGKWVEDLKILSDLRSATPPPVVQLDADQYKDVLQQIDFSGAPTPSDDSDESITAAGGLDRNRGGAEKLRRYWTVGPGGLKIRWNTGGDWTRCVRLLSKYLGPRAKGYCALRHHEMTGMWPGDRANKEMSSQSLVAAGFPASSADQLNTLPGVIRASADFAAAQVARARVYNNAPFEPVVPSAEDITEGRSGKAFKIPLVIPEGISTGDGRSFDKGSLGMRTFPLPLLWQPATGEGHDTSYIVGRIDRMERIDGGIGNAYGVFDTGPYGAEAQRLVENKMLRWVSADLDKFEVNEAASDEASGKMRISKGRIMGVTLVAKPAFQECTIELVINEGE